MRDEGRYFRCSIATFEVAIVANVEQGRARRVLSSIGAHPGPQG